MFFFLNELLTEVQLAISLLIFKFLTPLNFFAYPSPSVHISKLISEQEWGNRALHSEKHLNAMSCEISPSGNKSGSASGIRDDL